MNWRLDRRRLTGGPLAKSDRRRFERFKHLLFHTVASPKLKLFPTFIVLIDNAAVRPRELNRMANDRAQHSLEIKSRTDRLAHVSQSFQFTNRSSQFARPRLELLKQADVFDGDDGLVREGLEKCDLLFSKRTDLRTANNNYPDWNTFSQQRRDKAGPSTSKRLPEVAWMSGNSVSISATRSWT